MDNYFVLNFESRCPIFYI